MSPDQRHDKVHKPGVVSLKQKLNLSKFHALYMYACLQIWCWQTTVSTKSERHEMHSTPRVCAEPTLTTGTPSPWSESGIPPKRNILYNFNLFWLELEKCKPSNTSAPKHPIRHRHKSLSFSCHVSKHAFRTAWFLTYKTKISALHP